MCVIIYEYSPQHYWSVSADTATGAGSELCVQGNRVVWLEGLNPQVRTVKKVYSVETDVLQAFWCLFRTRRSSDQEGERGRKSDLNDDDGGEKRKRDREGLMCVCVREQSCLTLFLQTGAIHYVSLPFPVSPIL